MRFTVRLRELRLSVDVEPQQVTYALRDGADATVELRHAGDEVLITAGEPVTRPLKKRTPLLPRPPQPPGREPAHRGGTPP